MSTNIICPMIHQNKKPATAANNHKVIEAVTGLNTKLI